MLPREPIKKLSIIIPAYNEESTIAEVVERVLAVELPGLEREIVISDDGSVDNTPHVAAEIQQRYPNIVQVYTSPINLGKGAATRLGINLATGDVILIQDADLELSPEDYPQLLEPILSGQADVVFGSRFRKKQAVPIPLRTRAANRFLVMLTNLLYRGKLTDMATGYKIFRTPVFKSLTLRSARFEFEPEVTAKLLRAGHRIVEVPISYHPRTEEAGKKIGWIDGLEYVNTLFKYRFWD